APVVFVGDGQTASAIDFCFAAAQAVAEQGDGEISYQCKALLQIALECAQDEASAARDMLAKQTPKVAPAAAAKVAAPKPVKAKQEAPARPGIRLVAKDGARITINDPDAI
ncbi:hypothetical protein, partial [Rhizobium leguminosarum]|uniref:hypothetical protein n=1 Tax=Rhizobium leguminosarum TaxID=384 RepID=UPI0013EF158B